MKMRRMKMKTKNVCWKATKRFIYVQYRQLRYWYRITFNLHYYVVIDQFNDSEFIYYVSVDGGTTRRRYMAYNWENFKDADDYAVAFNKRFGYYEHNKGCIVQDLLLGYRPMKDQEYVDRRRHLHNPLN
jgi:hypothetical protein